MLKKGLVVAVILLLIGLAFAPSITASEPTSNQTVYFDENGTLSGYVKDTSMNPIEGARVRVYFHETYEENYTDSSGYYHVTNIPICYCLKNATVSKKGYISECVLLSIDETTTHNFVLTFLGETLYVGGIGAGNYSRIQDAVDNASDGDTVFVYGGTYFENVVVDKSICLIGENKNSTIIDGSMNKKKDVICVTASHVGIEKFTIKNGKNGILIDGDYGVVDNLNIVENIIIDNIQYGVFFFRSGYNNVLNNIILNNIYGIKAYEFCSNIIFGNIISSSSEAGIHLTSAVNAGNCMNNTISFNTLQNNGEGIILFTSYNNKINNNNFYGNSKDAIFVWSNSNNWNYNYWNRARLFPKPILGLTGKNLPIIPWVNFDWHPAKEPYDITVGGA